MKHSLKITLLMVGLFLCSQIIGLLITNQYIDYDATEITGNLTWKAPPKVAGVQLETPEVQYPYIFIPLAILIGTALIFLIIKFQKDILWKLWFFLAVVVCLTYAFGAFIPGNPAMILAAVLAYLKIFKKNIFIHNLTELFVYAGLASVFVPMKNLDVSAMVIILLFISAYDVYAVWKSKHMVKMAKYQTKMNVFAGILLPYELVKKAEKGKKGLKKKVKHAVLGGGDIGFPLMFTGVVMKGVGLAKAFIITPFVTLSLLGLLLLAEKNKFYPAMPVLTAGCLIGYGAVF